AAFEHAIASGCEGAELDVHLTADKAILVHHNGSLNYQYTCMPDGSWLVREDSKPFAEMSLSDIQQYRIGSPNPNTQYSDKFDRLTPVPDQIIPTLEEVIQLTKQRSPLFKLIIEIKSDCLFDPKGRSWQPLVDAVLAEVERLGFTARIMLCGFDWS